METLAELLASWYESVATQLANFPADLRIEQWLFERFPGLRSVQERSLVQEVGRSYPLLAPAVARLTPPKIYRPTLAMNAAQAVQVSRLCRRPELLDPFDRAGLADIGERLSQLALDPADQGHRSDMAATTAWAKELGLAGWYQWLPSA